MAARVMVACLVLAACGPVVSQPRPTAVTTPTAPASGASASRTPAPTATPFPSLPPTSSPTSLADSPWWRGSIEVGMGDGRITGQLPIGGDPRGEGLGPAFARGPFSGRVVAGSARGSQTDLWIIDVPTGRTTVVVSQPDILDATLDPTGTVLYWVTAGGDEEAVWRQSLADGSRDLLFTFPAPAASAPHIVPAAYVEATAQVALSADGHRLAAMRCRQDGCRLGVMELAGGDVARYEAGALGQSLLGFADGGVSLVWQCVALPAGELVDDCGRLDARAVAAEMARNLTGSAELPAGWHLETRRVANSPPMAFLSEVVAVPDDGGDPVPFTPLGVLGQG